MKWYERVAIGLGILVIAAIPVYSAVQQETLINLQNPASAFMAPLRLTGVADNATNPTVKMPVIPCVATAAAPLYTEGHIVPCSMDLSGSLRTSSVFAGTIGTVIQGNAGSNAQAWWAQIGDTTNGPVAVKAASTAVGATDKALAVSLSPNSALPTGTNTIGYALVGPYSVANITTKATTVVKASTGTLHSIVINNPTGTWTAALCDNATNCATGTFATIAPTTSVGPVTLIYDTTFTNGLAIVTAGTTMGDITVTYK